MNELIKFIVKVMIGSIVGVVILGCAYYLIAMPF